MNGWTTTDTAANCTYSACSTACALCAPYDTAYFPADSQAWGYTLSIGKPICIIGQGTGLTKISFGAALANGLIYVNGVVSDNFVRISGIKFYAPDMTSSYYAAINSNTSTNLSNCRVDHCSFNYGYYAINAVGFRGVIDHDTMTNTCFAIQIWYGDSLADYSWVNMIPGTSDALFVEDCQFNVNSSVTQQTIQGRVESGSGGKLVVRRCLFDFRGYPYTNADCICVHLHGNSLGYFDQGGNNNRRAQSVVEVYDNQAVSDGRIWAFCVARGGSWLVHDNKVTAPTIEQYVEMYEEESPNYVTFSPHRTLWPAEDQIHNTFFWNDTSNGSLINDASFWFPQHYDSIFIQKNRDYWLHAPQPSGGYEYFNGRHGASSTFPTNKGTSTAVDSSVTDSTGTMVFSSGPNAYFPYVPYTYPHPLQGVAVATKKCTITLIDRGN